ncbi:MAG: hypothetical protein KC519_17425, partial [Anaerolineae bacterium]|nr:hypothetical protein [Anaerolineae bacterium]
MRLLRSTLIVIGVVQLMFGLIFILVPGQFATFFNLPTAPEWVNWLFAMMGARFAGYAAGMFLAARDPPKHRSWIPIMIGIQSIDWLATIFYLLNGAVTLAQVTTAAFLPLIFIAVLAWR